MPGVPHRAITASGPVQPGPGRYYGAILKASGGGAATVDVYDGPSAAVGELIDSFSAASSGLDRHDLSYPLHVEIELFVSLGSNVANFTLFFESDAEASGDPPYTEPQAYTYG